MKSQLLLVHSPLVGPSSWEPVAVVAGSAGRRVTVPDLTPAATAPEHRRVSTYVSAAIDGANELDGDLVLVGHSGAGALLPAIADGIGERCRGHVFVDAVVPPVRGEYHVSPSMIDVLDAHTDDELLARWLDWWPLDVVQRLVPDARDRDALMVDMPRLPRQFYGEPCPVPAGWTDRPNAYLQLSDAYDEDAAVAWSSGWPVARIDGTHLSIVTDPIRILSEIDGLWGRATASV